MSTSSVSVRQLLSASVAILTLSLTACLGGKSEEPALGWQGWSATQQDEWYAGTQGSRLMPLAWLRALEQADAAKPFTDPDHLSRFRLLLRPGGALPVGFAIDDNDDTDLSVSKLRWFDGQGSKEQWVGLNCSACHTGEIRYQGETLRVDGGPALFDYQIFVEAVDAALKATAASGKAGDAAGQAKWRRFAARALACTDDRHEGCTQLPDKSWTRDTAVNRGRLLDALGRLIAWEDRVEDLNKTPLRYGYGRVDAFGHIFNKVSLFTGAANPTPNPADAPVSYPFLWDIYRHDKLQWNGIVESARVKLGGGYLDVGALGRNSGEVIGVFGDVVVRKDAGLGGYKSSIWADNLDNLEHQLRSLKAPAWPATLFGKVGDTSAGQKVFAAHCASCHQPQPGTQPYKVHMEPQTRGNANNTDPWMACNAITFQSSPGNLAGTRIDYFSGTARYTQEPAPIAKMLATTVKGAMAAKKGQIVQQAGKIFLGLDQSPRVVTQEAPDLRPLILNACYDAKSPLMAYKARPLDGIWATGPYLHNGSVPTLRALLLPAAQRPTSFLVGTREYDPANVGYSTSATAPGNSFRYDTSLPGNSNRGHEYGVKPEDVPALLDYLKTL
ncbi:di-heme-cytochrome C peroxidase [Sphingobium sufflavum]|uniref:di-heme-cytochrome C peroxidase n=1 Tax=Sphingobium sufflavum TaxID=1129547 RepID=UPI001F222DEB|nr:di-heme-cytochrome C peroxidase [Sphingobium sufflavum]MCE7796375.1 di-heme-cytochrome C peroxidase [Sphingobium sufflavum]